MTPDAPIRVIMGGVVGPAGPPSLSLGAVVGADGNIIEYIGTTPTPTAHRAHNALYIAPSNASAANKRLADYICDGTDDHVDINAALLLRSVCLMSGNFTAGGTILVPGRRRLLGETSGDVYGGSCIKAKNSLNADVIRCDDNSGADWWHWGEIAYLGIDGNKANNSSGSGINTGKMGETSIIHHVWVANCANSGVIVYGGTPNNLAYISSFDNNGYGFNLTDCGNTSNLINPSFDNNGLGGIRVHQSVSGGLASVNVFGLKAERANAASGTHEPCIFIDDFVGVLNLYGGSISGAGTSPAFGTDAIKRTGSAVGTLNASGLRIYGYATQFNDTITTANSVSLGTGVMTLNITTRPISGDLNTMRHIVANHNNDGLGVPTFTLYNGAGTGAAMAIYGTDVAGWIDLVTGTTPTAGGSLFEIQFDRAYATTPTTIVSARNNAASGMHVHIDNPYETGWWLTMKSGEALTAATEYRWNYHVIG